MIDLAPFLNAHFDSPSGLARYKVSLFDLLPMRPMIQLSGVKAMQLGTNYVSSDIEWS